jgi:hypothetical protein
MATKELLLGGRRRQFDSTKMAALLRDHLEMADRLQKEANDQLDVAARMEKAAARDQFNEPVHIRVAAKDRLAIAEWLRGAALDLLRENVEFALGMPDDVRLCWDTLRQWVIDGRTQEAQALRAQFEWELEGYIELARQARAMAETAKQYHQTVPRAAELPDAIARLERLYETLFRNWQTPEELEDLVASEYRLPMARLDAIGALHPAPPAWHEQAGRVPGRELIDIMRKIGGGAPSI